MEPPTLRGFPPIVGKKPQALILGSFPSVVSLERGEYYAHPRNHFWPLGSAIFSTPLPRSWEDKVNLLVSHRIALWDVVTACERQGSLDQRITHSRPNPILELLREQGTISTIFFNGSGASKLFRAFFSVPKDLDDTMGRPSLWNAPGLRPLVLLRLPSTSPIPSRNFKTLEDKLPLWSLVRQHTWESYLMRR